MIIQSRNDFEELLKSLRGDSRWASDVETAKTDNWDERFLMGISFYFPTGAGYYLPVGHPRSEIWIEKNQPVEWLEELAEFSDKLWIFHNAQFDVNVLERHGVKVSNYDDTLVMTPLVNENVLSYSLDYLGSQILGLKKRNLNKLEKQLEKLREKDSGIGGWEMIPITLMGNYAIRDVEITWKLYERLLPALRAQGLEPLWERAKLYTEVLRQVAKVGIRLDVESCAILSQLALVRMQELTDRLGSTTDAAIRRTLHEQYGLPVLFRTPKTSLAKTDAPSLEVYALRFPEVKTYVEQVLEFRGYQKARSTWYEGFQSFADNHGRIHPTLLQHGTVTGRLSSRSPNLQQIPRKGPTKGLFIADDEEHAIWEFDYSQIEFRLCVAYAKCETLRAEIENPEGDVHTLTALRMGLTKAERQLGKTCNFLLIYGGGAEKLKYTLWRDNKIELSLEECKDLHSAFHKAYPEFKVLAKKAENIARSRGYVEIWNKRRRRLTRDNAYTALNGLIQGGASQVCMEAMIRCHREIKAPIILTVHDSLWYHLKRTSTEKPLIRELMTAEPTQQFGIPIVVDDGEIKRKQAIVPIPILE